jgi:hypothetical protein
VGQFVRLTRGKYLNFHGPISSISDDGETLRVIVSAYENETTDVGLSGVTKPDRPDR